MPPSSVQCLADLDLIGLLQRCGAILAALGRGSSIKAVLLFVAVVYPIVAVVAGLVYGSPRSIAIPLLIAALIWILLVLLLLAAADLSTRRRASAGWAWFSGSALRFGKRVE
jgi:hypothetical protein